jgi:peptide/nickel transport system substrate-binding protein
MKIVWRSVLLCAALTACAGSETEKGNGTTGGTLVITTSADADYLFPPLIASSQGQETTDQLFDRLADLGDRLNVIGDEGFVPHLAERWDWAPDSLSIVFHLNPRARWHDGTSVRASDVRFTHRLYMDPAMASPAAPLLTDIDSVSVRDSLTPVIWFKHRSTHQFFDAAAQMLIMPEHVYGALPVKTLIASDVIRHPVGSGRFRFVRWVPGSTIEIVADTTNYQGRAKLDRVIWTISPDFTAAVTKLLTGEADLFEAMRSENVAAAARIPTLRVTTYPGFVYGFLLFNLRDPKVHERPHPIFGNAAVRRALTMAVDRVAIVKNVFDSLAAPGIGPEVRAQPTSDTTLAQIPYDPAGAARLLDSLGWRLGSDGMRHKGGQVLAFTVITPASSKNRARCAVLMQEQLKTIGVRMDIQTLETNACIRQESVHDFDAAMHAWSLDASLQGVKQIWGTAAGTTNTGTNYGSYASSVFDAQIDSALAAPTLAKAKPLFSHAYRTMLDDAPAIWLYDAKGVIGVQKRVRITSIRPDSWWIHLADWYIPAGERIGRDRLGLGGH